MRYVWRSVLLLAVFVGVGLVTAKAVVAHAVNAGQAESQVQLAGAMAGLFAGGAAVVLVGITLILINRRGGARD